MLSLPQSSSQLTSFLISFQRHEFVAKYCLSLIDQGTLAGSFLVVLISFPIEQFRKSITQSLSRISIDLT